MYLSVAPGTYRLSPNNLRDVKNDILRILSPRLDHYEKQVPGNMGNDVLRRVLAAHVADEPGKSYEGGGLVALSPGAVVSEPLAGFRFRNDSQL